MREVTSSHSSDRLKGPLSEQIYTVALFLENAFLDGVSVEVEQAHHLVKSLRDMVPNARRLEDGARQARSQAPVAYDLASQAADELKVVRSFLAEEVHSPGTLGNDELRCAFARLRALLDKSEAIAVGTERP